GRSTWRKISPPPASRRSTSTGSAPCSRGRRRRDSRAGTRVSGLVARGNAKPAGGWLPVPPRSTSPESRAPRNAVVNQDLKEKFARAADALNRADFAAAIEILSDILGEVSENAEAWCRLGLCYLETVQPDFALEALTRAVKTDPGHATAHYL